MEFEDYIEFDETDKLDELPEDIAEEGNGYTPPEEVIHPTEEDDIDPEELKVYYNHLDQLGILRVPEDFEFDGTYNKLEEALNKTKDSLQVEAKNELQAILPDDFKPLIDYALAGGKSLDAYIDAYSTGNLENLDLSKLENQRKVLYECYKQTTQYKPEKIAKMIDRYEELGTIEAEALDALEVLMEDKEQKKLALIENAKREREQLVEAAEEERVAIGSAIDTLITDATRANGMKAFLFNPHRASSGITTKFNETIRAISSNPKHLAQLADILLDYDSKEGIKLTKLEKQIRTKGVQSFKEMVKEKLEATPLLKGTLHSKDSKSQFNWDEFINT